MGIDVDELVEEIGWVCGEHKSEGIAFENGGCGTVVHGDCRSEKGPLDCRTVVGGECWEAEIALGCRTV